MTKVSRRPLETNLGEILERQLWNTLARVKNPSEARQFFGQVFTPTEIKMLSKRLEALKRIKEGNSYNQIRQQLKIMPNTISRMSNILHRGGQSFIRLMLVILDS